MAQFIFLYILLQNEKLLFRSEKIYAVLTVALIIWVGVLALLFSQNRRISRLEQNQKESETR